MLEKILVSTKQRAEYGEDCMLSLWGHLKKYTANDLVSLNMSYHTECFKEVTNKTKIERAKLRFEKNETVIDSPCNSECELMTRKILVQSMMKHHEKH